MLLIGIVAIRYVKEEVDEEDAKVILREQADNFIWSKVQEEDVEFYSAQLVASFGTFMRSMSASGFLSGSSDTITSNIYII